MKVRIALSGIFLVILVCSAAAIPVLAAPFPPPVPVPIAYPNVEGVWYGSGTMANFPAFEPYQMNINILEQQGSLFLGVLTFPANDCNFPGIVTGNVTQDRHVTMTIHAGCITSGTANFPATNLFNGLLSGDRKRINGVLQSLGDSATINILFTKQ